MKDADIYLKSLDLSGIAAYQYGFTPINSLKIAPGDKTIVKASKEHDGHTDESEERAALLRTFIEGGYGRIGQPPMIYMKKPFKGGELRKRPNTEICGIEIVNSSSPAADALVIQTAWAILSDCGATHLRLSINAIGDKESIARYEREIGNYVRKQLPTMTPAERDVVKHDPLALLRQGDRTTPLVEQAPKSMNTLSEASRIHFKEVLEFLESVGLPYEIDPYLLPNMTTSSHTIFAIHGTLEKGEKGETVLAQGSRWNTFAQKVLGKKEIPAVGATIWYPKKASLKTRLLEQVKPAKFYLVQLGTMARLQTLPIIEMLRQENISVYHSLTKENIGGQIQSAEYLKVSHLLIIGQKEAIEQSVVVRSTDMRVQETIKMCDLVRYLKQLR